MIEEPAIRQAVESVVSERLPAGSIAAIELGRDIDSDGDPILVVHLIVDAAAAPLEGKAAAGLTRHLRAKLSGIGEDAFPLVSFIATGEAGGHGKRTPSPEAA